MFMGFGGEGRRTDLSSLQTPSTFLCLFYLKYFCFDLSSSGVTSVVVVMGIVTGPERVSHWVRVGI